MEWPEITAETPLSEVKRIHQLIWDYVIEHREKPETPYRNNCVLCQYALSKQRWYSDLGDMCKYCPVKWPDEKKYTNGKCLLYERWCWTRDPELAKQIRDVLFEGDEVSEKTKAFHVFVNGVDGPIKTKLPVRYFENWAPGQLCGLYDKEGGKLLAAIPSDNILAFILYETEDKA